MRNEKFNSKHVLFAVVLAAIIAITAGCVEVKIKDYVDPQAPNKEFKKILVNCMEREMFHKTKAELALADVLNRRASNLKADISTKYLFPTRKYSELQIFEILKQNGFDGYLVVDFRGKEIEYPMASVTSDASSLSYNESGNITLVYNIDLIDVETQTCVWTSSSKLSGLGVTYNKMIAEMTKKICSKLRKHKFIK
ncbi:MAG TPA: hypothetical protein VK469_07555 [Candidatus Kapabacteria bacterium]|nr:hypothetical protein [Candidatus Kapabacteria bacterium]